MGWFKKKKEKITGSCQFCTTMCSRSQTTVFIFWQNSTLTLQALKPQPHWEGSGEGVGENQKSSQSLEGDHLRERKKGRDRKKRKREREIWNKFTSATLHHATELWFPPSKLEWNAIHTFTHSPLNWGTYILHLTLWTCIATAGARSYYTSAWPQTTWMPVLQVAKLSWQILRQHLDCLCCQMYVIFLHCNKWPWNIK